MFFVLRGIGLAGQDGALPSCFVLLGCPNHGKIFSSRRATPSSLCARPTFVDTCFESTSRRPYCILPDSNSRIKIQNPGRQQDSSSCYAYYTRGVPANIQDKITRAAFLLYNDDSKTVEMEGLTQLKVPKQRYAKLVRLSIFAYVFLRGLSDATAKTPTMVPHLPMDITSLAFHLRYLENFVLSCRVTS